MRSTARFAAIFLLFWAPFLPATLSAQTYPNKAVRILNGTPAGGPGDVVTRGAAQALNQALGQAFVVEDRVGADGMIVAEACSKATPDGYNLCTCDQQIMAINPAVRAKIPYDPRELVPVIHYGFLAAALLVHPSVPANSVQELFALARAKPGSVTWGSFGLASASNLYIEWLKNARNIQFYNVPYKAASLAWPAMLAGEVQVAYFAVGPASQSVKAGKARALAIMLGKRSSVLPDVPTYKEAGLDIPLVVTWFAMCAPPAMPREIVQRLNTEVAKGLTNNEAMRSKFMTSQGLEVEPPSGGSPESFAAFLASEREKYAQLVKLTGVKVE